MQCFPLFLCHPPSDSLPRASFILSLSLSPICHSLLREISFSFAGNTWPHACAHGLSGSRNTHARTYTREHALTLSLERCTDYVTVAFTTLRFGRFDWVARSNFSSLEGKFGREGMNGRSSVHRADTRLSSIREEVTVESSGDEHYRTGIVVGHVLVCVSLTCQACSYHPARALVAPTTPNLDFLVALVT